MAAHGDIRWPPVGSSDGRLRGEFHGRRHCRGAALSGAQFGVHRGVRAAWSHTCGGWTGLRQSARAVGGRRGRVNGNRDADRTCGGRVQDRGGAAFRKPSSAMANTRSRQCRSRVLPRSLPLPILDSPPFRVAGAAIVIAALAAAAYVFLVSPLARHQAQRQGAALAPAIATVIGFTFALGLAGNALDGANDLQQGRRPSAFFVGVPPPWRAETARVTWTGAGSSSAIRFPDCLLYLGEAGGTAVFYDARGGVLEALRLRADDITIAITHKRSSCPT
jgi:hypothetical protein